jgi:threonine dehydrogenase-like Zn-dependent dehydrogenase
VVVEVERAGVCGTDMEFFSGAMAYLRTGEARYPVRIGHEWAGIVRETGDGVDPSWLGRRVTGDTMLGCGHCARCAAGRQHLCADRYEIGVRNGWPGALAERLPVPVRALQPLPGTPEAPPVPGTPEAPTVPGFGSAHAPLSGSGPALLPLLGAVDPMLGALVEPGGNALRAVQAAAVASGERLLIIGPGTIGLLAALMAAAQGVEVHLLGLTEKSLTFPRSLGFSRAWTAETLPDLGYDAVIDASTAPGAPAVALDVVEPGRRAVFIGLSAGPSLADTRRLVLKDVTAVGILSASGGLAGTVELYATGKVDPRPLVAATVGLDEAADVLAGRRRDLWGQGPKIHIDPRLP